MFASSNTLPDYDGVRPIVWEQGHLRLLDQRKLPQSTEMLDLPDVASAANAIREASQRLPDKIQDYMIRQSVVMY